MTNRAIAVSEIRDVVEAWALAVNGCDLDGVIAAHSDEVVMFDVPKPHRGVRGIDAYRSSWPSFFEWIRTGARFEIDEIHVEADDDVASPGPCFGAEPTMTLPPSPTADCGCRSVCAGVAAGGRSRTNTTRSRKAERQQSAPYDDARASPSG